MTWFRVGGGGSGIPASLKSGMNDVLNKKFGTSIDYPANGWPDDVNLLGLLEEKKVSGSVVSFDDGANDVPLKSCVVSLASSLDGYSEVNVVRSGKNLLNVNAITDITHPNNASVVNNGNGSITVTTTTQQNVKTAQKLKDICPNVKVGETYYLKATSTGNQKIIYLHQSGISWSFGTAKVITSQMLESDVSLYASGTNSTATISDLSLTYGSTATEYEPFIAQTIYTADLGRTIYGGEIDLITGEGTDENDDPFTFNPVPINSLVGSNVMFGDGDLTVVYRSGGTLTPYVPTLISKSITANGTYRAIDDQATGYSEVVVNVPRPTVSADPIMSANAFVTKSGVSGTDVSTVARSFTMSAAGTLVFASGSYGFTNTGSNDGYFEIQKNGVSVVKQYCNTSTNTPITIPNISVEENDVVDLVVGFDNAHSSCNFQFYSAMVVLSEV